MVRPVIVLLLLAGCLFPLIMLTGCGHSSTAAFPPGPMGYRKYTNWLEDFSFRYPPTWSLTENTNSMAAIVTRPLQGDPNAYLENFGITVVYFDPPYPTLAQYDLQNIGAHARDLSDFDLITAGDATIDGTRAKWFEFTYSYGGRQLQCIEYEIVRGDRAYVTFGSALPSTMATYHPLFLEFAYSLDITYSYSPYRTRNAPLPSPGDNVDYGASCVRALLEANAIAQGHVNGSK